MYTIKQFYSTAKLPYQGIPDIQPHKPIKALHNQVINAPYLAMHTGKVLIYFLKEQAQI
jgi:hypothetical protein